MQNKSNFKGWQHAWRTKNTPWIYKHSDRALRKLLPFLKRHGLKSREFALVPLCGNSEAPRFLRNKGLNVTCIEYVPEAVQKLKSMHFPGMQFRKFRGRSRITYSTDRIEIHQMDFFKFDSRAKFGFVYDRAAFVAIDRRKRASYASILQRSIKPGGLLLINTYTHRGGHTTEPPFPITPSQLRKLFSGMRAIKSVTIRTRKVEQRFRERGMTEMSFNTTILKKKLR